MTNSESFQTKSGEDRLVPLTSEATLCCYADHNVASGYSLTHGGKLIPISVEEVQGSCESFWHP